MFKNERGFTLIEMLIVLMIISVLIILIVPNLSGKSEEVNEKGCEALVAVVQAQVDTFYLDYDRYPEDLMELQNKEYITDNQRSCSDQQKLQYKNGRVYIDE